MSAPARPLAEVTHVAIQELVDKMGVVDTIRFLNQFNTGFGDYTKERDRLFKDLTLDELLEAMAAEREGTGGPNKGAALDRGQRGIRTKSTRRVSGRGK